MQLWGVLTGKSPHVAITPEAERQREVEAREDLERRARILRARVRAQRGGR